MIKMKNSKLLQLIIPVLLIAEINTADAQSSAQVSYSALEEIVVTARKREEGLQNTPISITALTNEGLEKRNIVSIDQVSNVTPNLTINTSSAFSGSSQTPAIFLRGIGQTDFTLNTDPGVGIYVDGVYISRSVGGLLDLVDTKSVEVLRGPQGTLFGRNTIGGAINIVSNPPAEEFSGKVKATVGEDDWRILSANVSVPFSDTFRGKFAINDQSRDGHVVRTDGVDLGDKNSTSLRASFEWDASESLSFSAVVDDTDANENGTPLSLTQVNEMAPFVAIHNIFVAPTLVSTLGAGAFFTDQFVSDNLFVTQGSGDVFSDLDVTGVSLTTEYEAQNFSVKSITAYRDLESSFSRDGDASPLPVNATSDLYEYDQFSQELQFQGTALDDRLKWIFGLYYFEESGNNNNIVDFGFVQFRSGGTVDNESYAAFAQTTYDINERLSLTAGLRYTDETRQFNPITFVTEQRTLLPTPPFPPFLNFTPGQLLVPQGELESSTDEFTPLLNLSYQANQNLLTYFSFSQGFKSGGFTQRIFPALPAVPSFEPENVDVYEAGFKYDAENGRFRLNGSVYFTDYTDLQVTVQIGVAPTTQNAGLRLKGLSWKCSLFRLRGYRFSLVLDISMLNIPS